MLVVGLGNPGLEYENTRHNAGFRVLDHLSSMYRLDWKQKSDWEAEFAETIVDETKIRFLKPLTYMNLSGKSVRAATSFWKLLDLKLDEKKYKSPLIVIHDELDFDLGRLQLKIGGSAGGHNGISNIIQQLSTKSFYRLRIGVGHPRDSENPQIPVSSWVLTKARGKDKEILEESERNSAIVIDEFLKRGEEACRNYIAQNSNNASK